MIRLIVGCGYLGLRVAKLWLAQGDTVYVVTRKPENATHFQQMGLHPILADVTQPDSLTPIASIESLATVLVAVGMDRSRYDSVHQVYVQGLSHLLAALPGATEALGLHLIYISSTGVYGDFDGQWVDENASTEPRREGGVACLEAERLIQTSEYESCATVLRFAGIYGPGRVPTQATIANRDWKRLSSAGYLNLIQVDDGAAIVQHVAKTSPEGQTYCVSDGQPVLRREYYSFVAQQLGLDEIPWQEVQVDPASARSGSNKRVSNEKLVKRFDYSFQHPDYRSGVSDAIESSKSQ